MPETRAVKAMVHLISIAVLALAAMAVAGAAERIGTNDLAGAAKAAALEFTAEELSSMLRPVQGHVASAEALHAQELPNALQPAFYFDPRPARFRMPENLGGHPVANLPSASRLEGEDLAFATILELAALLRSKAVTSEQLTRLSLDRLKRHGARLRALVQLTEERALAEARRADQEIQAGQWRGPLHGVPYAVKDLLDVAGTPRGWGVTLYTNEIAAADASVVARLERAGAVLVAKLSLGELAMGDVWHAGKTLNPWNPEKGSSGSSAGPASAVAAGLVPFAIGSETHGSIVSPAMTCGVTGLRPTFGRVSRAGAMTLSWSMDKIGVLARAAEDAWLVLDAIRGTDGQDRAVVDAPLNYPSRPALARLRIGYLDQDFSREYAQKTSDLAALEELRSAGFELRPVRLPEISRQALEAIVEVEAAAFFDELTRSNRDDQLAQQEVWSWPNTFRAARFVSAVDYLQANRLRSVLIEKMHELFQEVDLVLAPSWAGSQLYFSNLTGHPAVLVPNGDPAQGPAGFCILAGLYREGDALALAAAFQRRTGWHKRRPDLGALKSE
jgi:Asp-tRNA(Asn)/Glu-tRNA(Gln) amidotransferase A subunit family amidase